ncbi:hypothetical protein DYB25_005857, partial [Aphanomyces astaci]
SLLGLKLSADKTPITLNAWWIAYSKTKGGEVICFKLSYSRQINLVDCANEYTRHLLASRGTNSLFLIKPAGYRSLGRILSALEGCYLALVKMRMIHIKTTDLPLVSKHIDSIDLSPYKLLHPTFSDHESTQGQRARVDT